MTGTAAASDTPEVRITGCSVYLPEPFPVPARGPLAGVLARLAGQPAPPPEEAHLVLGRKGLLYKEPATRMALCAVHRALGLPEGKKPAAPLPGGAGTAVVASSNLGNVETVGDIVGHVRSGRLRDVSALAGPNASSNIVASTVAIRFCFTAPNLMVCSGATGGLDAVRLGSLLLRTGRASRVVVVGTEPADEVASRLNATGPNGAALRAGAACLVLETEGSGVRLGAFRRSPEAVPVGVGTGLALGQGLTGPDVDPLPELGDTYGASGVVYAALAAMSLTDPEGPDTALVACGDEEDGYALLELRRQREEALAGSGAR